MYLFNSFRTKKIKYLSEHIGRQHGIKVDSKSLGQHCKYCTVLTVDNENSNLL